ncbi:hypothetical protein [Metabacillus idriensis]|uniref:hypothetical protein n=1 Tax=Metabacillus idriensis TaxID=324768 RepID=UPI001748E7A8|nr:hypothetical protein [Metabacillus idriensis]
MANTKNEQTGTEDAVLLMFLSLVENDGIEVNVTLNINGAIVSGVLISSNAYYDGITESSKQLKDDTMSRIVAKRFSDLKDAYIKQKQEEGEKEKKQEQGTSATYLHLRNARYHNSAFQSSNTAWWRGKISSVDAFSFDSLI